MPDTALGYAVLRTKLDTSGLKSGFGQATQETQKFAGDASLAIKGIGGAFAAIAASQGLRAYVGFMRDAASEAQQASTATALYEKALRRNNQSVEEGRALVKRLADQFGVTNSVVEESATFLLRQGASLDTVDKALVTAGASAAAAGFDIATAFGNVSTAVATGNSALLKTSGIVTTLGAAEQAYAKSLGKTVEGLTQEERIQARVAAIYKETASEIEDVDILLKGLPKSQANVNKEWTTFRQTAGNLALKVLVPLNDGLSTGLKLINSLPEPVKQGAIAMSGAATAGFALSTGITAIKTALTGLNALGLLSFGPAGWIVLGAAAVAGLAVALAGTPREGISLTKAVDDVQTVLGDTTDFDTFNHAVMGIANNLSGPVKDAFTGAVGDIWDIVSNAEDAGAALARIAVGARLSQQLQDDRFLRSVFESGRSGTGAVNVLGPEATAAGNRLPQLITALQTGDFAAAKGLVEEAAASFGSVPSALADFVDALTSADEAINARVNAVRNPNKNDGDGDGQPGKVSDVQKRVKSLREELAALQREVDLGLADAETLAERQFDAVDSAVRDLIRLGASGDVLDALLGDRAGFDRQVRERAARIAPLIRAELFDAQLRAEQEANEQLARSAHASAIVAQQKAESDRLAAVARAPLIRADQWDNAWFAEREEIENLAVRAHNDARVAQTKKESEDLAARARAPLIRAEQWDLAWFAEMDELDQLQTDIAAARVMRENSLALKLRQRLNELRAGTDRAGLAGTGAPLAQFTAPTASWGSQAAAIARDTLESVVGAYKAGLVDIKDVQSAVDALTRLTPLTVKEINELTDGVLQLALEAERAKQQAQAVAAFESDPGLYGPKNMPIVKDLTDKFTESWLSRSLREAGKGRSTGFDSAAVSWGKRQDEAADQFADTVVRAGFGFGEAAIQAIKDGDIAGVIRAGLSSGASILGGADLGSLSLLGGSIGIGSLIAGGLGLIGTLIGALTGGGREAEERRRDEASRARSVPAVNINFTVNQSNTYNGAPRDPANEQAFARQADTLFESIYRRHLGPRLDRIEQRLGIAGA